MKVLIANLGSTSLKWRLFDFSNGAEQMLHKGGFERVADYPQAINDCLAQLTAAGVIQSGRDLAAVGFKTIMAKGCNGCVRLDESVTKAMEAFSDIAPAHNPPYITGIRLFAGQMPGVPLVGLFETAFYQWISPLHSVMRCRRPGLKPGSGAGASTVPVISSSQSGPRHFLAGRMLPSGHASSTSMVEAPRSQIPDCA